MKIEQQEDGGFIDMYGNPVKVVDGMIVPNEYNEEGLWYRDRFLICSEHHKEDDENKQEGGGGLDL